MATLAEIDSFKDFEVIWVDSISQQLKDMDNVTLEIYHYVEEKPASITSSNKEPYLITEGISDTLSISASSLISGYITSSFILQGQIVCNDLASLGCPPNDYVVPNTINKVSLVNGRKVYALSACELASLINLDASGYFASAVDGYVILSSLFSGEENTITIGSGTLNSILGIVSGESASGMNLSTVFTLMPTPMQRISIGVYAYPNVSISAPEYKIGERYYALIKGLEPISGNLALYQEDFTVISKISSKNSGLTFSFYK